MKSNWAITRQRSEYHFDNNTMDPRWDTVQHLGHIVPEWTTELAAAVAAPAEGAAAPAEGAPAEGAKS